MRRWDGLVHPLSLQMETAMTSRPAGDTGGDNTVSEINRYNLMPT